MRQHIGIAPHLHHFPQGGIAEHHKGRDILLSGQPLALSIEGIQQLFVKLAQLACHRLCAARLLGQAAGIIRRAPPGILHLQLRFLLGGKAGGTSVNLGQGYELEAIAGATIGGVSTSGGIGRISGILIGVLVFELLKITMQFLSVNVSWTYIVQGIVIVLAVALDIRKYIAKK